MVLEKRSVQTTGLVFAAGILLIICIWAYHGATMVSRRRCGVQRSTLENKIAMNVVGTESLRSSVRTEAAVGRRVNSKAFRGATTVFQELKHKKQNNNNKTTITSSKD